MKNTSKYLQRNISLFAFFSLLALFLSGSLFFSISIKAQQGDGGGGANIENTNCTPVTNGWYGTCPTIITNFSVSPPIVYDRWKTAPTMPTNIILPVYSPTNLFTQVITFPCTGEAVTNTENVTYSVSGFGWTNFSAPYTNFPAVVTNSFTAQAYVVVKSSDTNLCPSPGVVFCSGDDAMSTSATFAANDASGSGVTTWDPYGLQHQCRNIQPSPRSRTTVGVGEPVTLTLHNIPNVTWILDVTDGSHGTLDTTSGNTTTWTAPNYAVNNSMTCTVTAQFNDPNTGAPTTDPVVFTVLNPMVVNMTKKAIFHTSGSTTLEMICNIYIAPANVNFLAVVTEEEDHYPYHLPMQPGDGTPVAFMGSGCYSGNNGQIHGTPTEVGCTSTVDATSGTLCASTDDCLHQGSGLTAGSIGISIPCQWKCNGSAWNQFPGYSIQLGSSDGPPGYGLVISKCGANYSCKATDPTVP